MSEYDGGDNDTYVYDPGTDTVDDLGAPDGTVDGVDPDTYVYDPGTDTVDDLGNSYDAGGDAGVYDPGTDTVD
jgi:hypothetical protein